MQIGKLPGEALADQLVCSCDALQFSEAEDVCLDCTGGVLYGGLLFLKGKGYFVPCDTGLDPEFLEPLELVCLGVEDGFCQLVKALARGAGYVAE